MLAFLLRRLVLVGVVAWGAATLAFFLLYLSGDPVDLLLPLDASPEARAELRHAYGFDQPLYVQYGRYLWKLLHGDFGVSLRSQEPALALVLGRMPATLKLAGAGLLFALILGLPAGVIAAIKKGSALELLILTLALLGQSIPVYFLGLVLIMLFGLRWHLLPISGYGDWRHLVLPTITVGTYVTASIARLTRNGVLQELRSDYVRTARA
ncbi:MAG TPA: ABC transporter permease, partial [Oceanithermus sp.]|nr:ABC transporter permease [Oceanithermus sp.]